MILLKRDVDAIQIPSGEKMRLPSGSQVRITQSLGGSHTVITQDGYLARINEEDADALGVDVAPIEKEGVHPSKSVQEQIMEALRTCYDPEIPVNIVDLGLIYQCNVDEKTPGEYSVDIKMTLTAPGCGMGGILANDVYAKVGKIPGVKSVNVDLVFEPVWDQSMMSEAARLQLGFF